ncbi:MAG: plastocyanin/azurin family copper-binding protein [Roseibacillus sp.]|nr:plastocyanin/azurin family copper-binding protein [Roseibacillus sp.]
MSTLPAFPLKHRGYRLLSFLGVLLLPASVVHDLEAADTRTTIRIGTLPGLRYDLKRFDIKPGAEVELIFSNSDTMLHNLVIVKPGTRNTVVNAALALGSRAPEVHFVPSSTNVLWATKVVASGESFTLRFTAPATLAEYSFVCTYPGHGFVMHGSMHVTNDPKPSVANTDPSSAETTLLTGSDRAILKRIFMPDSGPASIAVHLPEGHSYCWDAGACSFRYAWKGGFVEPVYRQPGKLVGEVYYRESNAFPLRIGGAKPRKPSEIRFLGYALDDSGIPEFEYEMDGILVKERIEVRDDRLLRRFRTTSASGNLIWFSIDPEQVDQIDSNGQRKGDYLVFRGDDAREFYLTISSPEAAGK